MRLRFTLILQQNEGKTLEIPSLSLSKVSLDSLNVSTNGHMRRTWPRCEEEEEGEEQGCDKVGARVGHPNPQAQAHLESRQVDANLIGILF